MKTTCLWLRGFPPLIHSEGDMFFERTHTEKPKPKYILKNGVKKGQKVYFTESHPGGKKSSKNQINNFSRYSASYGRSMGKIIKGVLYAIKQS
jgi:hypothetical protein